LSGAPRRAYDWHWSGSAPTSSLGADVIVVPSGSETGVENALLMGRPVHTWMPASNLEHIAAIEGVDTVSPQLYLATLRGATCCSVPDVPDRI